MKKKRTAITLTFLALFFFLVGIFAPMATFKKFYIFNNTYSILSATMDLLIEGEYFIFLIIFSFSIIFPILKIITLFKLNLESREGISSKLKFLETAGKWSMLDVFVIAFFIMTIKLGAIASIEVHFGIYAFAFSVILSMIATHITKSKHNDRCSTESEN